MPDDGRADERAGSEGRDGQPLHDVRGDHGVDRRDERGRELRHRHDGIVIAVDGEHDDVGDQLGEQALAADRHHRVVQRHHHSHGHADFGEPSVGAEAPEGGACFEHRPPVRSCGLIAGPLRPVGVSVAPVALDDGAAQRRRCHAGQGGEPAEAEEVDLLEGRAVEVAGRGTQDDAADPLRVPPPDLLGDRLRPSSSRRVRTCRRRRHPPSPRRRRRSRRFGTGAACGSRRHGRGGRTPARGIVHRATSSSGRS